MWVALYVLVHLAVIGTDSLEMPAVAWMDTGTGYPIGSAFMLKRNISGRRLVVHRGAWSAVLLGNVIELHVRRDEFN